MGIFCRILSLLLGSFAEETRDFKEPTNRSQAIDIVAVDTHSSDFCYEPLVGGMKDGS